MISRSFIIALLLCMAAISCASSKNGATSDAGIKPLVKRYLQDVKYGPHDRNVLDLWLVKSKKPAPLVLYIHGGGFRQGDKSSINKNDLKAFLEAGFSVAAINYRLTNTAPAPAAYLDCGRALQFLRFHAKKWNIDPELVASTGGSAGAGTSLWLAFHDDLADPGNDDPVARQSTRLTCVAVKNAQSSYDPRFAEKIGIPRPNFDRHVFFLPFYDITPEEIDSPKAYVRYEIFAPISYISGDDPPVLLEYNYPNVEVNATTGINIVVHHPKLGIALKEEMDKLGIECVVQYLDQDKGKMIRHDAESNKLPVDKLDFIKKHFAAAKQKRNL
jgi:acetyl esterase